MFFSCLGRSLYNRDELIVLQLPKDDGLSRTARVSTLWESRLLWRGFSVKSFVFFLATAFVALCAALRSKGLTLGHALVQATQFLI